MTTVTRPKRSKARRHLTDSDGKPLCGVRKGGNWQLEFLVDVPTCKRCIVAVVKQANVTTK